MAREILFARRKLVLALTPLFLDQFRQTKILRTHKIMLFPVICGFLPRSERKWGLSRANTTPRDKRGWTILKKWTLVWFFKKWTGWNFEFLFYWIKARRAIFLWPYLRFLIRWRLDPGCVGKREFLSFQWCRKQVSSFSGPEIDFCAAKVSARKRFALLKIALYKSSRSLVKRAQHCYAAHT